MNNATGNKSHNTAVGNVPVETIRTLHTELAAVGWGVLRSQRPDLDRTPRHRYTNFKNSTGYPKPEALIRDSSQGKAMYDNCFM
jgi:hypothetical protein